MSFRYHIPTLAEVLASCNQTQGHNIRICDDDYLIGKNLSISGTQSITLDGGVDGITIKGDTVLTGEVIVVGSTLTIPKAFRVRSDTFIEGDLTLTGDYSVTGSSVLNSDSSGDTTLTVNGTSFFNGQISSSIMITPTSCFEFQTGPLQNSGVTATASADWLPYSWFVKSPETSAVFITSEGTFVPEFTGFYRVDCFVTFSNSDIAQSTIRLNSGNPQNILTGTTVIGNGVAQFTGLIQVQLASSEIYILEYLTDTTRDDGFGISNTLGTPNLYAKIIFTRL